MKISLNDAERDTLRGLPWMIQTLYVMGLRPRMDFETGVVGVRGYVSHNTLISDLTVEGAPGIAAESPSKEQIRRAIKALERAGLLTIQSKQYRLIVRLLLAETAPRKADIKPAYQTDIKADIATKEENPKKSGYYIHEAEKDDTQPGIPENVKADTHISGIRLPSQLTDNLIVNSRYRLVN